MGANNTKMTESVFYTRVNDLHGVRYFYDKFIFVDRKTKGIITCRIHGDFLMAPKEHLKGQGCKLCGRIKVERARKISYEENYSKFQEVHLGKYKYPLLKNFRAVDKIPIECPVHGVFWQKAYLHKQGHGCPKCAKMVCDSVAESKRIKPEEWTRRFKDSHSDWYDYKDLTFDESGKVLLNCELHGEFSVHPYEHWKKGTGCKKCSRIKQKEIAIAKGSWLTEEFFINNPELAKSNAYLYLVKIHPLGEIPIIKIGITTHKNKNDRLRRLKNESKSKFLTVIGSLETTYYQAWKEEQEFIERNNDYRYYSNNFFNGHTECFKESFERLLLEDYNNVSNNLKIKGVVNEESYGVSA